MSEQELADKLQYESNIEKIRRAVKKVNAEREHEKPLNLDELNTEFSSNYWSN